MTQGKHLSLLSRKPSTNRLLAALGVVTEVQCPDAKRDGKDVGTPSVQPKYIYYWDPKSLRIRTLNWYHIFIAEYLGTIYNLVIATMVGVMLWQWMSGRFDLSGVRALAQDAIALEAVLIVGIVVAYVFHTKPSVYCLENVVHVPPPDWQVSRQDLQTIMKAQDVFGEESMGFMSRMLDRSGTGDSTHWPPSYLPSRDGETKAARNLVMARNEAEAVIFPLVQEVLDKTGIKPSQIDFLVINCSLFVPTPSLCAMVCNRFKLRSNVRSYNLGGMGCSANVISVDLAKQLVQNEAGTRALVISTENLTQNLYEGDDKSMLLQNTLFRVGGCALLLSSRRVDSLRAKYKLLYTGRTQMSDDNSYKCVFEQEDYADRRGIALSKDIVSVAGKAMKHNFVQMGPHILPIREQIKTVYNRLMISLISNIVKSRMPGASYFSVPKPYTPNFAKGIDHFCIHAGGRAVIEGVQKNLDLQEHHMAPSVQTLLDWGNTSSSSIWYEMSWIERFGNLKRGDRVLQVAFGSGFKCNSAVWLALRVDRSKIGVPLKENGSNVDCSVNMADKDL